MTVVASPQVAGFPPDGRVVLYDVSWGFYEQMLREIGDTNAVRLTYDAGRLEIMSPSGLHERVKTISGRLIETFGTECGIPVEGCGSWTLKREDLKKGLEPDECYYVQNLSAIAGKQQLDLSVDPPPDLAIEVDISPHDVAREPIYAALGVPEIWRYDGRQMVILQRMPDATYVGLDRSLALPMLPIEEFNRFLRIGLESHQHVAVEALRSWLRTRRPVR
jgi:Uma2 family endonuclease